MSAVTKGKGLVGLLKRGWHEIPEVMASSVMALVGIGFGVAGVYIWKQKGPIKKHKLIYDVIRPDDPRAATVKRSE